jgi:hypothetical protein
MNIALVFAFQIILAAQGQAARQVPKECPVLMLWVTGGLGSETDGGLLAAIWPPGIVLRAQSPKRPSGPHVLGTVSSNDTQEVMAAARHSPLWQMRSGGVAVDMPDKEVQFQDGDDRRGWVETPGVNDTNELRDLERVIFAARLQSPVTAVAPKGKSWPCPAVRWAR